MEHPWRRVLREMRIFIVEQMTYEIMDNMLNNARPLLTRDSMEDIEVIPGLRQKTRRFLDILYYQNPCDTFTILVSGEPNVISDTYLCLTDELSDEKNRTGA